MSAEIPVRVATRTINSPVGTMRCAMTRVV